MGCSGAPEPTPNALRIVLPRDAEELDPRFIADPYGIKVSRLVFASLVTMDPRTLEAVPDLAERIEIESDTRYRVTLREGLVFSDGSILDTEDVRATYASVVDPAIHSRYAETYRRITAMRVEGPLTIVFELDSPHAPFMTDLEIPILRAEDAHHAFAPDALPIGAGPFVLTRREPGHLRLSANPRYYGPQPAHRVLELVTVRDDNTRTMRVLAGSADLAINAVPPLLLPMFDPGAGYTVASAPGVSTTYVGLHTESPLLRDVRVRRAIAHAIDREALIEAKLGGRADLASSWVPLGHWAEAEGLPTYEFDPARARALLDEAGLVDPEGDEPRARMTLRTSSDRGRVSLARAIAAMLRDVGLEVEVRPSESASLIAELNRGRFELVLLQLPELFEPQLLSWFFASDRIPGEGGEGANRWRFRSASLDRALERGRTTVERAARREAYVEAQRILAAELPVVPLFHEHVVAVQGPRLPRFDVPRDGRFRTLAEP